MINPASLFCPTDQASEFSSLDLKIQSFLPFISATNPSIERDIFIISLRMRLRFVFVSCFSKVGRCRQTQGVVKQQFRGVITPYNWTLLCTEIERSQLPYQLI